MKCCNCKESLNRPHQLFQPKHNSLNKHEGKRKPSAWCEACWKQNVEFNERAAKETLEKARREIKEALERMVQNEAQN